MAILSLPLQGGGRVKHKFVLFICSVLPAGLGFLASSATAQTKAYRQTNLASSVPGAAAKEAQTLNNPWAIAFLPDRPFFIADSSAGSISSLNSSGVQANAAVAIPPVEMGRSMPSGIASDGSGVFGLANAPFQYVVVTQDGTIAGFSTLNGAVPSPATLVRDDFASGAVYTALALLHPVCCAPF